MGSRGMFCFLLILFLQEKDALGEVTSSYRFNRLYDGSETINASFTPYQSFSKTSCAALCQGTTGCWLFTWDKSLEVCSLLNPLTSMITKKAASSTLMTYYVSSINGKRIRMTNAQGSWTETEISCQHLDGRLFVPPDNTYSFVLHHVTGAANFWIGMRRQPSNLLPWYNLDWETTFQFPQWAGGQPNNVNGMQYYAALENGYLYDLSDNDESFYGLCEV